MKELGTLVATVVEDRGLKKVRVNVIKGNHIYGFIRPVAYHNLKWGDKA